MRVQRRLERTAEELAILLLAMAIAFLCKYAVMGDMPLTFMSEQDYQEMRVQVRNCGADVAAIQLIIDSWAPFGALTRHQSVELTRAILDRAPSQVDTLEACDGTC